MLVAEWKLKEALAVEREEGFEKGKLETAKALGLPVVQIAMGTGLHPEEIAVL